MINEQGLRWRKSKASQANGSCVEMAALADGTVAVRDSKNPGAGALVFTRSEIKAWVQGVQAGEFDDLTA